MQFLVLTKKAITIFLMAVCCLVLAGIWYLQNSTDAPVTNAVPSENAREIHLVTGEFKGKLPNGKEIEAYRWDPGTIFVEKDEQVTLIIYGVNGAEHPFHIEGTNIKGTVKKGAETKIPLLFNKEGVYRLVCELHPDKDHSGPMIAYIVVD